MFVSEESVVSARETQPCTANFQACSSPGLKTLMFHTPQMHFICRLLGKEFRAGPACINNCLVMIRGSKISNQFCIF